MIQHLVSRISLQSELGPISHTLQKLSWQPAFDFITDESGSFHSTTTFLVLTIGVSIPMGLFCLSLYRSLCGAGRLANLLLGLF